MKIARISTDAILPTRKHYNDAGLDLYALEDEYIIPQSYKIVKTGIKVELPEGTFGLIHAKSKSNYLIGGGIIDAGYQGELLVKIINTYSSPLPIDKGEAIAQLIIIPCITPTIEEVPIDEIHKVRTERATSGGITEQHAVLQSLLELVDEP